MATRTTPEGKRGRSHPIGLAVLVSLALGGGLPTVLAAGPRPLAQRSAGLLTAIGDCVTAQGTGESTHIGRFDISLAWCLDPATGAITGGNASVVTASGDHIALMFSGQAVSPSELVVDMDIVGGTGRFEGASGELRTTADVAIDGSWTSTGSGWISY